MSRRIIDTNDVEAGFDLGKSPPELREAGIEVEDIEIIPEQKMRSKAQEAKFMEEKVLIEIEAGEHETDPLFVYGAHNGVTQYVMRGVEQWVKRKFLYALIQAKTVRLACSFGRNSNGDEFNRLTPNARTTHRVFLIRDNNPDGGMKWFKKQMAFAG